MTDTIESLYAKWLDAKTTELQQAAQSILHSDDPEAALRAVLEEPEQPTDAVEHFADRMKQPEPDGPFVPELNRRITAAEAARILEGWSGPVSPHEFGQSATVEGVELTGESAMAMLKQAEEEAEAEEAQRRTEWSAEWGQSNSAPAGRYTKLGND